MSQTLLFIEDESGLSIGDFASVPIPDVGDAMYICSGLNVIAGHYKVVERQWIPYPGLNQFHCVVKIRHIESWAKEG